MTDHEEFLQNSIPDIQDDFSDKYDIDTLIELERVGKNRSTLLRWLQSKQKQRRDTWRYGFVPDRTFERHVDPDNGWIRFGLAGDTHLVNNYHDNDAWRQYITELYKDGVVVMFHAGDVWDGCTPKSIIYRGQQMDVPTIHYPTAMRMVSEGTPDMGIKKVYITGNHDTKLYENTGIDAGEGMERQRERDGHDDFDYLQPYYARVELSKNPRLLLDLVHLRRAPAYSIGYALQTYLRNVPPRMRSHILGAGHTHKKMWAAVEDETQGFLVGGFQKANSYVIRQRKGSVRGGWLVEVHLATNSPLPYDKMRAEFIECGR